MNILTTVIAALVALEHLYIMYLETIATASKSTSRVFGISTDRLKDKNPHLPPCTMAHGAEWRKTVLTDPPLWPFSTPV